jgi:type II secretory pathway predicted ATPase ExeA
MMPQVREALACLQYGISERKGFVVLTGEVGTGKTTLLKTALNLFPKDQVSTAFVFNPRLDVSDFLEFVLTDFGIQPRTQSKSGMLLQLNRWLIDRYRERGLCVIIIDEAQDLSMELLEEVRLLTNLETSSEKLLQIVLSGQPELEEMLRVPGTRQLRQRVALWSKLRPLTAEETQAYISERLRIAGASELIIPPESAHLVHRYAKGIPRIINLVCEHSMINAYVDQVRPVPVQIVEAVGQELELADQPFLIPPMAMSGTREEVLPLGKFADIGPVTQTSGLHKEGER